MTEQSATQERSYGCTFGCGNPYDYILVDVQSGETLFLCVPCYVKTAADMIAAITDPDNPDVQAAMREAATGEQAPVTGTRVRRRGHNAPATADDPDLITAYDDRITVDELPDEFK